MSAYRSEPPYAYSRQVLMRTHRSICIALMFMLALACGNSYAAPASQSIGVVFPDTREPYRSVFTGIIDGVQDKLGSTVKQYVIKPNEDLSALRNWAESENLSVIIALGTTGLSVAKGMKGVIEVIVGGVLVEPHNGNAELSGISLAPDPEIIFDRFRTILPSAKRVSVIYQPSENGWLIERARAVLRRKGLTLNEIKVHDLRESAQEFRKILNELRENEDILWLLQDDSVVDDQAILPLVLRTAWDRNLTVVSNNPAHVKKGALLSVYPNNRGLGISLADLALKQVNSGKTPGRGITPLRDLLIAMNTRTAEHIGLYRAGQRIDGIDLTFPVP